MKNAAKRSGIPLSAAFISLLYLTGLTTLPAEAEEQKPIRYVLELFTSQGCSSCPPADKLLGTLAKQDGTLALTMPVDYWDYLGWPDTLASKEHTKRQYKYAGARGDRSVYTPQIVVNGQAHAVGSQKRRIQQAMNTTAPLPVHLTIEQKGRTITMTAKGKDGLNVGATMWLVTFSKEETVKIRRGENRGRTITYTNVVKSIQPLTMWKGKDVSVSLPVNDVMADGVTGCAILLQTDKTNNIGQIIGAALLPEIKA